MLKPVSIQRYDTVWEVKLSASILCSSCLKAWALLHFWKAAEQPLEGQSTQCTQTTSSLIAIFGAFVVAFSPQSHIEEQVPAPPHGCPTTHPRQSKGLCRWDYPAHGTEEKLPHPRQPPLLRNVSEWVGGVVSCLFTSLLFAPLWLQVSPVWNNQLCSMEVFWPGSTSASSCQKFIVLLQNVPGLSTLLLPAWRKACNTSSC